MSVPHILPQLLLWQTFSPASPLRWIPVLFSSPAHPWLSFAALHLWLEAHWPRREAEPDAERFLCRLEGEKPFTVFKQGNVLPLHYQLPMISLSILSFSSSSLGFRKLSNPIILITYILSVFFNSDSSHELVHSLPPLYNPNSPQDLLTIAPLPYVWVSVFYQTPQLGVHC